MKRQILTERNLTSLDLRILTFCLITQSANNLLCWHWMEIVRLSLINCQDTWLCKKSILDASMIAYKLNRKVWGGTNFSKNVPLKRLYQSAPLMHKGERKSRETGVLGEIRGQYTGCLNNDYTNSPVVKFKRIAQDENVCFLSCLNTSPLRRRSGWLEGSTKPPTVNVVFFQPLKDCSLNLT